MHGIQPNALVQYRARSGVFDLAHDPSAGAAGIRTAKLYPGFAYRVNMALSGLGLSNECLPAGPVPADPGLRGPRALLAPGKNARRATALDNDLGRKSTL